MTGLGTKPKVWREALMYFILYSCFLAVIVCFFVGVVTIIRWALP